MCVSVCVRVSVCACVRVCVSVCTCVCARARVEEVSERAGVAAPYSGSWWNNLSTINQFMAELLTRIRFLAKYIYICRFERHNMDYLPAINQPIC